MNWSETKRLQTLPVIIGLLLIVTLIISKGIWVLDGRLFPKTPLISSLPDLPYAIDFLIYGLLLIGSGLLVLRWKTERVALGLALFLAFSCLFDFMRMQPWAYLYWLILLALSSNKPDDETRQQLVLSLLRYLVIALYIWSGIHKINPEYYGYTHEYIVSPFKSITPESWESFWSLSGYIVPYLEVLLGLLLLNIKTRKSGVVGLVVMHLFILTSLGPFGNNWNIVVWPWNIGMSIIVLLLFYNSSWKPSFKLLLNNKKHPLVSLFTILLIITPSLNLLGHWDHYLSFSLYSGKTKSFHIYIPKRLENQLNKELRPLLQENRNAPMYKVLMPDYWSMKELGVPVYPSKKVFEKIASHMCSEFTPNNNMLYLITTRSGKGEQIRFKCGMLKNKQD